MIGGTISSNERAKKNEMREKRRCATIISEKGKGKEEEALLLFSQSLAEKKKGEKGGGRGI